MKLKSPKEYKCPVCNADKGTDCKTVAGFSMKLFHRSRTEMPKQEHLRKFSQTENLREALRQGH